MKIADHEIRNGGQPFLIAEASINHNGSIDRAMEMISHAKLVGCDAIKFQTFKADDVCDAAQMHSYISQGQKITEPRINIFLRSELPETAWPLLKAECDRVGIVFMSTPETPADLDILLRVGIPAIKIGSDNLTNLPMLRYCSRDDVALPIILSCGMSDIDELNRAMWQINGRLRKPLVILVCTSEYPCKRENANLARIAMLKTAMPSTPIGFSDHTIDGTAAVMATALGAAIIETHFTLDNNLPGPEHSWAKNVHALGLWVQDIRTAHSMMGNGEVKPTAQELENKERYQRCAT